MEANLFDDNIIIRRQNRDLSYSNAFEKNNKAIISGFFETNFEYAYTRFGKRFYVAKFSSERLSGTIDTISILISEYYMHKNNLSSYSEIKGKWAEIAGTYWTYNKHDEYKSHLIIRLLARIVKIYEIKEEIEYVNTNLVYLKGYICQQPKFRITPLGRKITDLIISVDGIGTKNSYIPCIVWNKDAKKAVNLTVGDHIEVYGRMQSRKYIKRVSPEDNEGKEKEAYELSVCCFKICD